MFRKPTEQEIKEVFPRASRGWETVNQETSQWLDDSMIIEGKVPTELTGTYMRNGPGKNDIFGAQLHHPIDGDGMVVTLTFLNGKVHFQNRYVQTFSHVEEEKAHKMLYTGSMGTRVPGGPKNPTRMRDPAHTNVFYWGGKMLACHEYALPHCLDPVTLETVGPDNLGNTLTKVRRLSAHFREDTEQDRLVTISFQQGVPSFNRKPKTVIQEYDRQWNMLSQCFLQIEGLNYAHDFIMTPDWYILHMTPFVDVGEDSMNLILSGKKLPGELMRHYPDLPSRMYLVQRNVKEGEERKIIPFETEPCHIFHFANAIQVDDNTVKFGATCLPPGFTMDWQYKVFLSNSVDAPGVYHNYVLDIPSRKCTRTLSPKVAARSNEFPIGNPYRHCVKLGSSKVLPPRYVYLMAGAEGVTIPFTDIVKYDGEGNRDDVWHSPEGCIGEPVFVPRYGRASAFFGDDDDGWIITQEYIPGKHETRFIILDAKNLSKGPICRIKAPFHIPFSFHGTHTPEVFHHPPTKL